MNKSESIEQIAKAMAKFQAHPMVIGVNATGYGYDYATLDKVVSRIYPVITSLGLSIMQPLGQTSTGEPAVHTIVMHTSGEWYETTYPISGAGIKKANDAQQFGASVTYTRRYGVCAAFGVAVGKDDDAACMTDKPAPAKKAPAGKKYKKDDPTPTDSIIAGILEQDDLQELQAYMDKHRQLVMESPKKDQIVSEFQIHKGMLEERGGK